METFLFVMLAAGTLIAIVGFAINGYVTMTAPTKSDDFTEILGTSNPRMIMAKLGKLSMIVGTVIVMIPVIIVSTSGL